MKTRLTMLAVGIGLLVPPAGLASEAFAQPSPLVTNLDFESSDGLAGWHHTSGPGQTVTVEKCGRNESHAVHLASRGHVSWVGPVVSLRSAPFDPTPASRVDISVWMRAEMTEREPAAWLVLEGLHDGELYRRRVEVGGAAPTASAQRLSGAWQKIALRVDDVPREGLANLCVGVDLRGAGDLWIDDFAVEVTPDVTPAATQLVDAPASQESPQSEPTQVAAVTPAEDFAKKWADHVEAQNVRTPLIDASQVQVAAVDSAAKKKTEVDRLAAAEAATMAPTSADPKETGPSRSFLRWFSWSRADNDATADPQEVREVVAAPEIVSRPPRRPQADTLAANDSSDVAAEPDEDRPWWKFLPSREEGAVRTSRRRPREMVNRRRPQSNEHFSGPRDTLARLRASSKDSSTTEPETVASEETVSHSPLLSWFAGRESPVAEPQEASVPADEQPRRRGFSFFGWGRQDDESPPQKAPLRVAERSSTGSAGEPASDPSGEPSSEPRKSLYDYFRLEGRSIVR